MFPQQRGQCLGSVPTDNHQKPYLYRIRCDSHISGCSQTCLASVKQRPGAAGSWLREPDGPRKASQGTAGRLVGGRSQAVVGSDQAAPLSCQSVPLTLPEASPPRGRLRCVRREKPKGPTVCHAQAGHLPLRIIPYGNRRKRGLTRRAVVWCTAAPHPLARARPAESLALPGHDH